MLRTLLLNCVCVSLAYCQASSTIAITGDVPSHLILEAEDLAKMPRETVSIVEHGTKAEYEGVPLREILSRAGTPADKELRGKALAGYVIAKARDGYQVVFTLAELSPDFANESVIMADKRDGKPLSEHLGPFRLIWAKDKAGARCVRMVQSLKIVRLSE